jgi:hypothetical protein
MQSFHPVFRSEPVFAITSDVDWASESIIELFIRDMKDLGVKPTVFSTHRSLALSDAFDDGLAEVGLHPNFLAGSSHGESPDAVIEFVKGLAPQAIGWRAHSFFDNSRISLKMNDIGMKYDSNACTWLQQGLFPWRNAFGSIRFPVFWEDDIHWFHKVSYEPEKIIDHFLEPGLKVLNIHPSNYAFNIPNSFFRDSIRDKEKSAKMNTILSDSYKGLGTRTLSFWLISEIRKRGYTFNTLEELYSMYCCEKDAA